MNKDILDMARELGQTIKNSNEYKNFLKKEENYQNDSETLKIENELEKKKELYKKLLAQSNEEKINLLNLEIKELNEKLMNKESYVDYIKAESTIKKTMQNINNILEYYTGISEDSSCGGCNKGCNK